MDSSPEIVATGWARWQSVLFLLALPLTACTSVSPGVTCDGIRALKIGMSKQAVARLLGTPSKILPGPLCGRMLPDGECWSYSEEGFFPAGVVFKVEFDSAALDYAHVYARPVFRERKPTLFLLTSGAKPIEGSDFASLFKCEGSRFGNPRE